MTKRKFKKLAGASELLWYCDTCTAYLKSKPKVQPKVAWGSMKGVTVIRENLQKAYNEIVKWQKNMFLLPRGNVGRDFIVELTRLINLFNNKTDWESIALLLVHVFVPLLLQKPAKNSRAKDNSRYLEKRLKWWKNGDFQLLMNEGEEIQNRLADVLSSQKKNVTKRFTEAILNGKLSQATSMINRDSGGLLDVNEEVVKALQAKHPKAEPAAEEILLQGTPNKVEDVIFEAIDNAMVQKAAKGTNGSGGPTQVDSDAWQHIICSKAYRVQQDFLCDSIARLARRLCTEEIPFQSIESLTACRLIALDKNPGIRPIGIGEILRRIIGKCVMTVTKGDITESSGPLQTCAGHKSGIEAAIHAMAEIYDDDSTEAILLIDASNAFNSLNRDASVKNMKFTCPPLAKYVENTYREPSNLYIKGADRGYIKSEEGYTQGDNAAMAGYSLGTRPLIDHLLNPEIYALQEAIQQVWFADDSAGAGKLKALLLWWKEILRVGPKYGYFPNPAKCVLIVKDPKDKKEAEELFGEYNMEFTTGNRHLGAVLGSTQSKVEFVTKKVEGWVDDVKQLAQIATSEPQAAYTGYCNGIQHRWTFFQRTIPGISDLMVPLENVIRRTLIPALVGRQVSDEEREITALPVRYGGLGIKKPEDDCDHEYQASKEITRELKDAIILQAVDFKDLPTLEKRKKEVSAAREEMLKEKFNNITATCNGITKRSLLAAKEKGASSWLTCLPLQKLGYVLNKQEFRDCMALRYNWAVPDMPRVCGCGKPSNIDHLLSCHLGGYTNMRHNRLRDLIAKMLKEVCYDVKTEPHLLKVNDGDCVLPHTNKTEQARLDISARGVWTSFDKSFFDVRVTHPNCLSNRSKPFQQIYKENEDEKKKEYNERVLNVEKGNFTPLVFLTSGGMSKECKRFINRLANLQARRKGEEYGDVVRVLRTKLRFALLKTTLIALRGHREKASDKDFTLPLSEISYNLVPSPANS